ncbi:hypothetical protein KR009_005397, partial [Drosophila setifemur]
TQSQLVYKIKNIECVGNPKHVKNISCIVKPINWNLSVVNMECTLLGSLINPMTRIQVFQKDYTNQYKPFLIDVNINMCDVIVRRNFIPYGTILWKIFKRFSNVNHSCPYKGQLICRDGYLDTQLIPPFPKGLYLVSLRVVDTNITSSEYVGTAKFYLQSMDMVKSKKKPGVN